MFPDQEQSGPRPMPQSIGARSQPKFPSTPTLQKARIPQAVSFNLRSCPSARPEETAFSARDQSASAIQPLTSIGYGSKSRPSASVNTLPLRGPKTQHNNGSWALSPPTLPGGLRWSACVRVSACVAAVARPLKLRGAGVGRLVSEVKDEKGGKLVASKSVPGLGPPGPCHAPSVLASGSTTAAWLRSQLCSRGFCYIKFCLREIT